MPDIEKSDFKSLIDNYEKKLSESAKEPAQSSVKKSKSDGAKLNDGGEVKAIRSSEFETFKREQMPVEFSLYEKACNLSEKIFKIKADPKKYDSIQESIAICHLNATPDGVTSLSMLAPLIVIFIGAFVSLGVLHSMFYLLFFLIAGGVMIPWLSSLPARMATSWRMKASNQMVLCIFYIVTYMRHTSNLENAIEFATDHLAPPLSVDLKGVLWNVETEKFDSVQDSLNKYLETWRKWNMEFIESFNLCAGSLYESSEDRRVSLLDKGLSVILDETYEKMLHYAHNLKSPITMLHMMGVILPILGLVILPLVVSFMKGVEWHHIGALYNVALPVGVYLLGKDILSKRPTGYGDTDIGANPEFKKYQTLNINVFGFNIQISALLVGIFVFVALFLIGISPLMIHMINPHFDVDIIPDKFKLLDYKTVEGGKVIGPFGLGATILSLFIPLAFGLGLGSYFFIKSRYLIKIRNRAKKLENEFATGLFHLGSKMGDGLPSEIAFGKVAEMLVGTTTAGFFEMVNQNITRLGQSVEDAIFNKQNGALTKYPSDLIESSMKVLIESSKKGPRVAAQALINVSQYVKEIHRVNERLRDLLADIISSMTSQISFLTPTIAAIVIGITSMITSIIGKLTIGMSKIANESSAGGGLGGSDSLMKMFSAGIPTFYFQIVVGIYVVQIVYILTILSNGIQNGSDKLNEKYQLGRNLMKSTLLYCIVSAIIIILFNSIASSIMGTIAIN